MAPRLVAQLDILGERIPPRRWRQLFSKSCRRLSVPLRSRHDCMIAVGEGIILGIAYQNRFGVPSAFLLGLLTGCMASSSPAVRSTRLPPSSLAYLRSSAEHPCHGYRTFSIGFPIEACLLVDKALANPAGRRPHCLPFFATFFGLIGGGVKNDGIGRDFHRPGACEPCSWRSGGNGCAPRNRPAHVHRVRAHKPLIPAWARRPSARLRSHK